MSLRFDIELKHQYSGYKTYVWMLANRAKSLISSEKFDIALFYIACPWIIGKWVRKYIYFLQISWGSWRRGRRGGGRVRRLWRRARGVWSRSTCCCASKCLKNLQSDLLERLTKSWNDWSLSHSTNFICDVPDFRKIHSRTHATFPSTQIKLLERISVENCDKHLSIQVHQCFNACLQHF